MNNEEQARRDMQFEGLMKEIAGMYHSKNISYDDAFMKTNESIDEAFADIDRKVELMKINIKYRDHMFKAEKFRNDLKDLAIYAVMSIMWMDENGVK